VSVANIAWFTNNFQKILISLPSTITENFLESIQDYRFKSPIFSNGRGLKFLRIERTSKFEDFVTEATILLWHKKAEKQIKSKSGNSHLDSKTSLIIE